MSWIEHLKIMSRARKSGDFFPSIGQSTNPAPKGSHEDPVGGHWWTRLGDEVHWFRHTTHHLTLSNWPSMHIVQITDVHLRDEGPFLERCIQEVRGLNPDLIVLTGDLITKNWTQRAVERFLQALSDVPKLAILGNWEHWVAGNLTDWKSLLAKYNVQLLVETVHTMVFKGVALQIVGTDDHLAGKSDPSTLCAQITDAPTLCLTHSPAHVDVLAHQPIDLILAGHAHGGQIRLPKLGALWVPKGTEHYIAGWYKQQGTHLFVCRGMGWSVAPLRWNCPPEVAHIFINHTQ